MEKFLHCLEHEPKAWVLASENIKLAFQTTAPLVPCNYEDQPQLGFPTIFVFVKVIKSLPLFWIFLTIRTQSARRTLQPPQIDWQGSSRWRYWDCFNWWTRSFFIRWCYAFLETNWKVMLLRPHIERFIFLSWIAFAALLWTISTV